MKSLKESLFGNNITNDPWEIMIDHLNIEKYGRDAVINDLENIYNIGDVYSFDNKQDLLNLYECLLKSKGRFVMILKRLDSHHMIDYCVGWIPSRHPDLFYRQCVGDKIWFRHLMQWSTNSLFTIPVGIKALISKLTNTAAEYESCSVITDKQKIKDIIRAIS